MVLRWGGWLRRRVRRRAHTADRGTVRQRARGPLRVLVLGVGLLHVDPGVGRVRRRHGLLRLGTVVVGRNGGHVGRRQVLSLRVVVRSALGGVVIGMVPEVLHATATGDVTAGVRADLVTGENNGTCGKAPYSALGGVGARQKKGREP